MISFEVHRQGRRQSAPKEYRYANAKVPPEGKETFDVLPL